MRYSELLDGFAGKRVLVLGDVMLDEYIFGSVDRISPEAPVMVVRKRQMRHVPGGAANVAKNVTAMGGTATVVGVIGDDATGDRFESSMGEAAGVTCRTVRSQERVTTSKTRVVANHSHQVLRIDEEDVSDLSGAEEELVWREVEAGLGDSDCLVMSDYVKGVLTEGLVSRAIAAAREKGVPVVVNAKPGSAGRYRGASLLTLNRKEAKELTRMEIESEESAFAAALAAREVCGVEGLVVTLGDKGLVAVWEGGRTSCPAPEVEAYDAAGAGDTALATLALGMCTAGASAEVMALAVQTSAKVVQHVGVAVPSEADLAAIRALN